MTLNEYKIIAEVLNKTEAEWNTVSELVYEFKQIEPMFDSDGFIRLCGFKEIMEGVDTPIAKFEAGDGRWYMYDDE